MTIISGTLRIVVTGCAAGATALLLDEVLAYLTLGFFISATPHYVLVYLVAGTAAAAAVAGCLALGRRAASPASLWSTALAVVYAAPLSERVCQALLQAKLTAAVVFTVTVGALVAYAAWALILRRIVTGGASPTAHARHNTQAGWLAALSLAVALALNRNVVDHPFEPAALALDAATAAVAVALAFGLRLFGPVRVWTASVAMSAVVAAVMTALPAPAGTAGNAGTASTRPPHLILVIIDTLRQDVFRRVVDETEEGRAFRQALAGAVWFDNAIAASPWTPPSVASILTGLYPSEHSFGATGLQRGSRPLNRLPESLTTVAEHLRERGYRTAAIVANPILHPVSGIAQGIEHFEVLQSSISKLPLLTALAYVGLVERDAYQPASEVRRRLGHWAEVLAKELKPVFFWLHVMDPHRPFRRHADLSPDPGAAGLTEDRRLYRDEVRYSLRELTRMFGELDDAGLWRGSAFVLVSDHGEMFPGDGHHHMPPESPMIEGHGHALFDELVRVPLVVRAPEPLSGERRVGAVVSHADLHDTIADLLGLDFPKVGRDRVSLHGWTSGPGGHERQRRLALIEGIHVGPLQRAIRGESFKLIHFPQGEVPDELYDLEEDPGERTNQAGDDERLAEAREEYDRSWSVLQPPPEDVEISPEIDEETKRRLKALGYVQ